jgi:two-component system OmpR family response regulator
MHLLAIEDDAEAAAFLAKGLRESGYTVDLATDGRDGLFQATEEKYDLLIVDRQLPHLDACPSSAALATTATAPGLVLSGFIRR